MGVCMGVAFITSLDFRAEGKRLAESLTYITHAKVRFELSGTVQNGNL